AGDVVPARERDPHADRQPQPPGHAEPEPAGRPVAPPADRRVPPRRQGRRRRGARRALPPRVGLRRLEPGRAERPLRAVLPDLRRAQSHHQPRAEHGPQPAVRPRRRDPRRRLGERRLAIPRGALRADAMTTARARAVLLAAVLVAALPRRAAAALLWPPLPRPAAAAPEGTTTWGVQGLAQGMTNRRNETNASPGEVRLEAGVRRALAGIGWLGSKTGDAMMSADDSAKRRGRGSVTVWVAGLALCALGCATPVGVKTVDIQSAYRLHTESALSAKQPSEPSKMVLRRLGLLDRFEKEAAGVVPELHRGLDPTADDDCLFALAELSFLHAQRSGDRMHFLASAVYAWALLFPG